MKVIFNPTSKMAELTIPPPRPARMYLPDWYKKYPAFATDKPEISIETGTANHTMRHCMPFLDSLTAGYIQETWQDFYFEEYTNERGEKHIKYANAAEPEMISIRGSSVKPSEEFYPAEFVFHPAWNPELPKGWSMLFVSPLNRPDLPFFPLSGVVDNDVYHVSQNPSNMPMHIKRSAKGIIPKGTPVMQMIPIKREDWESEIGKFDYDRELSLIGPIRQYFWGGYKRTYWHKKSYK
jgi:hypothetical protein